MTAPATRRIFFLLPLFLLAISTLNACGNKGPLYIPPPPIEQQGADSNTTTADNE